MTIHAQIVGDTAAALGLTVRADAPVLALCRALVAAGHDPALRLEAYRGDVLCLVVRSIGEGAELVCAGTGFKRRHGSDGGSPSEPGEAAATTLAGPAE